MRTITQEPHEGRCPVVVGWGAQISEAPVVSKGATLGSEAPLGLSSF
jgi:hypothetical protein